MLMYQTHTREEYEKIVEEFTSIPNSIFLRQNIQLPDIGYNPEIHVGATVYSNKITISHEFIKEINKSYTLK